MISTFAPDCAETVSESRSLELIQLPTAFPPPCLALAQKSVQKSSGNRAKSGRIEARGASRGRCGALLGFPLAKRAKNIQNVSSWTALRGPSETQNLRKLCRRRPNASQNCVQNLMSEICSRKLSKSDKKVTLYWTLDVLKT